MFPSDFVKKIMVCVDGSKESVAAAQWAITLAKNTNIELIAVYVVNVNLLKDLVRMRIFVKIEELDYEKDLELDGKRFLAYVENLARAKRVPIRTVLLKGVVDQELIQKTEEWGVDLLVLGELEPVYSRADASHHVSELVLRKAKCSVFVIKNAGWVETIYHSLEE